MKSALVPLILVPAVHLDESLERELANAIRENRNLGVIVLDVDRFKKFNDIDTLQKRSTVLRELGDSLAKFVRRGDLAFRYSVEAFTLILPESSPEDTRRRAEELRIGFLPSLTVEIGISNSEWFENAVPTKVP